MKKILTIVGARPQFVKAAIVSKAFAEVDSVEEIVIHTGQHYDPNMSDVFFEELNIPRPKYNLNVGSGSHGKQTGLMLAKLEELFESEQPDAILVYGDTNSTLAGALAAAKMHIPVIHVEAGLRSFNRRMPEEINRILTDQLSWLLFCPTDVSVTHLQAEGITNGVHQVGDVMYDAATFFVQYANPLSEIQTELNLNTDRFVLMTCHRAENTDDPKRLQSIMQAAADVSREIPVVFLVHPRTRKLLEGVTFSQSESLILAEPMSYLNMLALEKHATLIMTDSGGIQKEAFFFGVPCVTMRTETEWIETVEQGANTLVDADREKIDSTVQDQLSRNHTLPEAGSHYGNGQAATTIAQTVSEALASRS